MKKAICLSFFLVFGCNGPDSKPKKSVSCKNKQKVEMMANQIEDSGEDVSSATAHGVALFLNTPDPAKLLGKINECL